MHKELKRAIINWLFDHENEWQRTNACMKQFRPYIYDENGGYLIGGKEVHDFILAAERLIYLFDKEN